MSPKKGPFQKDFQGICWFSGGGGTFYVTLLEKKHHGLSFWFGFSSTNGKVVWGPVVWDSNRDTP